MLISKQKILKISQKIALSLSVLTLLIVPTVEATTINFQILPIPDSITITPSTVTIAPTATQQYTATAIFADLSTLDITNNPLTSWNSSNLPTATIDNSGLATGVVAGTSTITATYGGVTSNNATLTVGTGEPPQSSGPPDPNVITFQLTPEKRWDPNQQTAYSTTTNQSIAYQMEIRDSSTGQLKRTLTGVTDDTGKGDHKIQNLSEGVYDFSVKTISHLRSTKKSVSITWPKTTVDMSNNKIIQLKGGDVNSTYGDNFVNGLDFSTIANKIYTNNKKADLNRDNIVNGLDFAITTANVYKSGDN